MNTEYWNQRAREQGCASVSRKGADATSATERFRAFFESHYDFEGVTGQVLDFGCGWGRWASLFEKAEFYLGVDASSEMIELAFKANHRFRFLWMEEDTLDCADGTFDLVWICTVLQHIVDDEEAYRTLTELHRVLKPGGTMLMFENTSTHIPRSAPHVKFRTGRFYQDALHGYEFEHLGALMEAGERHDFMLFKKEIA